MSKVLVADDEYAIRLVLKRMLRGLGHEVVEAADGVDAMAELERSDPDLVITDLRMPRADGMAVLSAVRRRERPVPVIVLTGFATVAGTVEAMRGGAANFLTKPFLIDEVEAVVRDVMAAAAPAAEGAAAFLGDSAAARRVVGQIARVADSDATVLIIGESGTGKEVVARALHLASPRRSRPFVAVNCGAIPEALLESELFGHVKGAFTGAHAARVGRFAQALGGTLFLDEIGEMPLGLQVKLLRALQERRFSPVGEDVEKELDARILAATNRDLEDAVARGTFRSDLYYRLNVVPFRLPPLREHPEDVALLARAFLARASARRARRVTDFAPDALAALEAHRWPGNVRELENLIERLVVLKGEGELTAVDVAEALGPGAPAPPTVAAAAGPALRPVATSADDPGAPPAARLELPADGLDLRALLDQIEADLIRQALDRTGGNRQQAADLLRIQRTTLVEKLRRKGAPARGR